MKKLLLILLLAISVFGKNYSEPKIEVISWNTNKGIKLYCIEGYVFVYTWNSGSGTAQFLIEKDGKTVPMPCTDLEK